MTAITTRTAFVALFTSSSEAIEFEGQCLSIGRDLLPAEALAVLEDRSAEPAPAYWAWLASQTEAPAESESVTVVVSVGPGRPSAHYPQEERERNGATDYDVTIAVGSLVVAGGITLYTDRANGGMSSGGSPLDGWCSSSIVSFLRGLPVAQRRFVLASLECQADSDEIELDAPFTPGERVEARAQGEGADAGRVLAAQVTGDGWRIEVGWDTGVRTTVGTDEIRAER